MKYDAATNCRRNTQISQRSCRRRGYSSWISNWL